MGKRERGGREGFYAPRKFLRIKLAVYQADYLLPRLFLSLSLFFFLNGFIPRLGFIEIAEGSENFNHRMLVIVGRFQSRFGKHNATSGEKRF